MCPATPPKLMDRVRAAIRTRHYSPRTEEAYAYWIRRFIVFQGRVHPSTIGAPEIGAFLTWLAIEQHVSASTQNQALSALLFLYRDVLHVEIGEIDRVLRAQAPQRLPVVLTRDEVARVLKHLTGVRWIIGMLLYGAGLRLGESVELRVKDIDFDRRELMVRRGKRQKDRRTMLPLAVGDRLRAHLETVKRQHTCDLAVGLGRVVLPFALDRKYPNASTEWGWQFVFPAARICRNPRWGPPSRYHLHESAVQKAVAAAVRRAGLTKPAGPHTFRHSFATHLLEDGYDTVAAVDVLVSWNFRHIVRLDRIRLFNEVNTALGRGALAIYSPREVTSYGRNEADSGS